MTRLGPTTLRGRVALMSGLSSALAAALVASVVVILAQRMALAQEDAHLLDAARVFAFELRTRSEEPRVLIEDEVRELADTGIQIAVFAGTRRVGGSPKLSPQAADHCQENASLRTCALSTERLTVVTGRAATPLADHRRATLLAALFATALTALLGALVSLALARRVVRPLEHLRRRVEQVPSDDPGSADLGPMTHLTEVDTLRESLSVALSHLGAALQLAQRFASDAAHELRTPLTAIIGELDLALERGPGEGRGELVRAQRVAGRLASLVERLLILARSQARLEKVEEIDLLDLVEDAIEAVAPEARGRVRVAAVSLAVRGDAPLLLAMISNALENSLKFSAGPVTVGITSHARCAVISLEDEGPGVPVEERERVFAAFYRTRASRASDVPGHGIGLALIAHVVGLHGGSARFVERALGARLELELPV